MNLGIPSSHLLSRSDWLTAVEAAAYLGLPTVQALYQAVRRGQIPACRLGKRRLRFNRTQLDSLLGSGRGSGQSGRL
jgi:excisionase family DNA binding protein